MLISVIVPVYNTKKYLSDCLNSIVNQTYFDMEIILVDDGSTDGSAEICDEYAKKDNRICVIHQENRGCVYARLSGLQRSRGEYIGFVDSDDWIDLDMYQILMSIVEEKNCDIVSMGYTAVYESERKKKDDAVFFGLYEREKNMDDLLSGMMCEEKEKKRGIHPALCSKVIKRNLLMDVYSEIEKNITMGEDAAVFYPCCLKAKRIFSMKEYKYYYRIHGESMCHSMNIDTISKIYLFDQYMQKIFSRYEEKYNLKKQLKKYICTFVFSWLEQVFNLHKEMLYLFPYFEIEKKTKIILYGAGKVGESYYSQILKNHYCNVIAWADKAGNSKKNGIIYPDQILKLDYNKIVIAVCSKEVAEEIINELVMLGIEKEKIFWLKPYEIAFEFL